MTRWFLRGAVAAAGWGWVGLVAAQPPSPATLANTSTAPAPATRAAAPEELGVLLMRTTGQPDRRLKVLKRSTYSDGESLVDVQDLTSGQTFTLPGRLADRLPRESGTPPPVAFSPPVAPTVPPPSQPFPPDSVPPTRPPATSPTVVVQPPPVPAATPTQPVAQLPATPLPAAQTETVWRPLAAPVPTAPVPLPAPTPAHPPNLVPIGSASQPTPGRPTAPPPTAPAGDRWKPIPAPAPLPPPVPAPHPMPNPPGDDDGVTARGQLPDRSAQASPAAERKVGVARLPAEGRPAAPPVRPSITAAERRPTWTPTGDDWLAEVVRREMQPMADQLATALRPSVRVNAALGLGDMRYAARPEVKAVLARAAMTDPAVMVRTVCVRELARLGYNELGYMDYLRETAQGEGRWPEQLRLAALDALRLLTPRD